jgi:peptide/nickel transport system substrate-binding protein
MSNAHGTRQRLLATAGVAIAVVLVSCSQPTDSADPSGTQAPVRKGPDTVVPADEGVPKDGGTLVFGVNAEPDGFNPSNSQFTIASHLIASSMLESLTAFDASRTAVPYLAERFDSSDGGATWTIVVKPDIRFHDGTVLDAGAVKANLEAQQAGIGGLTMGHINRMTVVDDRTLEVALDDPWSAFPSTMAGQPGIMVSPTSLASGTATTSPVGTGPFELDRWEPGSAVVVHRNDDYWQDGEPHLDGIDFRIVTDPTSRRSALQSGGLDMMMTDDARDVAEHRDGSELTVIVDELGDAKNVMLNQGAAPFDNGHARRAVILATDSAAIADAVGSGTLEPTDQPFAEGTSFHQDEAGYPAPDTEAARAAADRYETETGEPLSFTLTTYAVDSDVIVAQALQAQWAEAGIDVEINSQQQAAAIKDLIVGNYQASLTTNFGYPDPDFNYIFLHSSHTAPVGQISLNFIHLQNREIDQLLDEARTTDDADERATAYRAVVRELNDDSAYVWLYRNVAAVMATSDVRGLQDVEQLAFANVATKTWYGDLWLDR